MIIFLGNDHSTKLYSNIVEQSKKDRDVVVSCQYRFRVPKKMIQNFDCINIHYGLLPEYAGCNPIFWQIKNGDVAGVTVHYMTENFDDGPIIARKQIFIGNLDADQLYEKLSIIGKELFLSCYDDIISGDAKKYAKNQNLEKRKYYRNNIDWKEVKKCSLSSNDLRAVHFVGKQYPVINIDGKEYEIRRCNNSI